MYGNAIENQPRFTISYHKCKTAFTGCLNTLFLSFQPFSHACLSVSKQIIRPKWQHFAAACVNVLPNQKMRYRAGPDFIRRTHFSYRIPPAGRTFAATMRPHSPLSRRCRQPLAGRAGAHHFGGPHGAAADLPHERAQHWWPYRWWAGPICAAALARLTPATPEAKDNCCDFSKQEHKLSLPAHELAAKVLVPPPLLATAGSLADLAGSGGGKNAAGP